MLYRTTTRFTKESAAISNVMASTALHPSHVTDILPLQATSDSPSPSPPTSSAPSVTPAQIAIIKATAPVLKQHGNTITSLFYTNLLAAHPSLRNIFNLNAQSSGAQPRALASAVLAYASHIDNLPALRHAVERIAHKHASLLVQPAQYAVVGEFLMGAIGAVLGDAAMPEIVDAWTQAYAVLAGVFVAREEALYAEHGEWVGWRRFRVVRRKSEAEGIASLYLAPLDGAALPAYLPGQYVSVQVDLPDLGLKQSRQYSLSCAPRTEGDYYRISVRREEGREQALPGGTGSISNLLYDSFSEGSVVELTHPQGEYIVDPADSSKEGTPLVLISAGVGATPNMAILESIAGSAVKRPVSWLHGSRSRATQPFADAVRELQKGVPGQISSRIFLRSVGSEDKEGVDFDFCGGRMDLGKLHRTKDLFVDTGVAEYYICGPESFMMDVRTALEEMGVTRERIQLELFATGDVA